jgi:hypothetical protein
MPTDVQNLHDDLVKRARRYGIVAELAALNPKVPGVFDGPTITLNNDYDAFERAVYLAHSIGSIAEWSLQPDRSHAVFRTLREAKRQAASEPDRLDRTVADYLAFENRTWEFAVWLVKDLHYEDVVEAITNLGRADMESMRIFHRTGKAPVWREFFARWNEEVRQGSRTVVPFVGRPIPAFQAIKIPKQEIVQEADGE